MKHINRRFFVLATGALLTTPLSAYSQPNNKVYRIGLLSAVSKKNPIIGLPKKSLRELGYEEGRDYVIDVKYLEEGGYERLPVLAAELVAAKVDVIVANINYDILAAKNATSTIPIIMMYGTAPVESGFAASLSRPGGNITGTTQASPQLIGRRHQLLREAVPSIRHIALLYPPSWPAIKLFLQEGQRSADALGIRLSTIPVETSGELDDAFKQIVRIKADALSVVTVGELWMSMKRINEFALRQHLPSTYAAPAAVEAGGLMSYSVDIGAIAKRTAAIIGKVLKGANPAEIPIEEPTQFDLSINMKTAKELGIKLPQSVLIQATKLIE